MFPQKGLEREDRTIENVLPPAPLEFWGTLAGWQMEDKAGLPNENKQFPSKGVRITAWRPCSKQQGFVPQSLAGRALLFVCTQ